MPQIRPISDLRNNFTEISKLMHETGKAVYLTKNGYGDMVVMSLETYERKMFESEIYFKLKEAEKEAKSTTKRLTHKEVFHELKEKLAQPKHQSTCTSVATD